MRGMAVATMVMSKDTKNKARTRAKHMKTSRVGEG